MQSDEPFRPSPFSTVSIAATNSSSVVALLSPIQAAISVQVFNSGTGTAFIEFGGANTLIANAASSMPIGAGLMRVYSVDQASFAAAVTATSVVAGTVFFTRGYGLGG